MDQETEQEKIRYDNLSGALKVGVVFSYIYGVYIIIVVTALIVFGVVSILK